jgi:hypothetical protein
MLARYMNETEFHKTDHFLEITLNSDFTVVLPIGKITWVCFIIMTSLD